MANPYAQALQQQQTDVEEKFQHRIQQIAQKVDLFKNYVQNIEHDYDVIIDRLNPYLIDLRVEEHTIRNISTGNVYTVRVLTQVVNGHKSYRLRSRIFPGNEFALTPEHISFRHYVLLSPPHTTSWAIHRIPHIDRMVGRTALFEALDLVKTTRQNLHLFDSPERRQLWTNRLKYWFDMIGQERQHWLTVIRKVLTIVRALEDNIVFVFPDEAGDVPEGQEGQAPQVLFNWAAPSDDEEQEPEAN